MDSHGGRRFALTSRFVDPMKMNEMDRRRAAQKDGKIPDRAFEMGVDDLGVPSKKTASDNSSEAKDASTATTDSGKTQGGGESTENSKTQGSSEAKDSSKTSNGNASSSTPASTSASTLASASTSASTSAGDASTNASNNVRLIYKDGMVYKLEELHPRFKDRDYPKDFCQFDL